jgi:NADP-dependent aldehyde dehydrogenase
MYSVKNICPKNISIGIQHDCGRPSISIRKMSSLVYGYNPKTGTRLEPAFEEATSDQVHNVVTQANKAFQEYKETSPTQVSQFLKCIGDQVTESAKTIIERATLETGYPEPRLQGELQRTVTQLNMYAIEMIY